MTETCPTAPSTRNVWAVKCSDPITRLLSLRQLFEPKGKADSFSLGNTTDEGHKPHGWVSFSHGNCTEEYWSESTYRQACFNQYWKQGTPNIWGCMFHASQLSVIIKVVINQKKDLIPLLISVCKWHCKADQRT